MFFGTTIDEDTSFALLDRFVERGGRWIDTADCYSFWASELADRAGTPSAVLGRWLAARPASASEVLIATKVGAEPPVAGRWPEQRTGLSRASRAPAFDGSLRAARGRARSTCCGCTRRTAPVPIEQTVEALGELTAAAAVRRVGASNHPAWRVERARGARRVAGHEVPSTRSS